MQLGVLSEEPWAVVEPTMQLDRLGQMESVFALSNGHIGLRGNLDEGEPIAIPGTYLNGLFEATPFPHAEVAYGYPTERHTLLNVTDGKPLRLLVNDEPLDVRDGMLLHHERRLDLRTGVLHRDFEWVSPAGQAVRVHSTRLVSFAQRAIAAIRYEVEPRTTPARITVQSTLFANEPLAEHGRDPRSAAALDQPLAGEYHAHHGLQAELGHRTRLTGLRMAAGMDHEYDGPVSVLTATDCEADLARVTFTCDLAPGQRLTIVKYIAYGWSGKRAGPVLRDQVSAALLAARRAGWDGLRDAQRSFLDAMWDHADIEVEGDPHLQQAVRFAIFQVVQAAARVEKHAIPAKGLTGRGYDGHTFWDMDAYTLPMLAYVLPHAARQVLGWRHRTLDGARTRARELRLAGAAFPWRTTAGEENSGYWPAGTAAFHINADIAEAVRRYVRATGDTEFEQGPGIELLVETARLWRSLGHHDAEGRFRIDGVTGPDEYTALVDNNTYTNLMAAKNLRTAADVARRYPDRAKSLHVTSEETAAWRSAAEAMVVPVDAHLGVTEQSEGFTHYRRWDFDTTHPGDYPLLLHYPYYLLYSSQVVKQADLVFALYTCGSHFSAEQKRRDFEYYEAITVRDSSLSAAIQAIMAAEVGHLDLAYRYFRETACIDLCDFAANTSDGLHLASMSGAWLVAVAGFGGLRDDGEVLAFAPRLPTTLTRIAFRLRYRGRTLQVDIEAGQARYELLDGEPMQLLHHGERLTVEAGSVKRHPCPPTVETAPVMPPIGREACRVGVGQDSDHSQMLVPALHLQGPSR